MPGLRVLQVLTCDAVAGTELMVATLAERADRDMLEMSVVTLDAPGPIAHRLTERGVPVRSLGERGLGRAFVRLATILRAERFDVVNAYGFKSTMVTRCLLRVCSPGSRFVCGVRGLHVAEIARVDGVVGRLVLAAERLLSFLVDAYDSNSRGAVEMLAGAGIDRTRLHYIPNGIDTSREPEGQVLRDRDPTILCVARFTPIKRHHDLLVALHGLVARGSSARLILVGAGPTEESTARLADELGLHDRVRFTGQQSNDHVRELMREASVFCLASAWEGMPGSVMEAMASSLPVVGTRVNGIADLVVDEVTGLLVPPGRPDLLAEALGEILGDPDRQSEFGRAGRTRIEEQFGVEHMVEAKQELYVAVGRQAA